MKKAEIDNLLRGIGMEPVVAQSTFSTTATQQKATSIHNVNSIQNNHHQRDESFSILEQLSPPDISLQIQLDYSRNGHAVLRSFLPKPIIRQLRSELLPYAASHALSAWRQKVEVQLTDSSDKYHRENAISIARNLQSIDECESFLESLGIDPSAGELPFLQHFNIWRSRPRDVVIGHSDALPITVVRRLCLSPYLAEAASILLNVPSIRLYQDSLFHKRAGDGWTPWHSDARMAPFDTSKMISFWIPLQDIPPPEEGGTGLIFVDGSQSDMALPYWNGVGGDEYNRLEHRYGNHDEDDDEGKVRHHMPLELGSVTVHNGWTLHCADSAEDYLPGEDRYALSITYVDGRAEVREDVLSSHHRTNTVLTGDATTANDDNEDVWSFRSWVSEVIPRTQFRHQQVPIVWPLVERDVV